MTDKEWVEYFEAISGRKPNAQEFAAAKGKEFEETKVQVSRKQEAQKSKTGNKKSWIILGSSTAGSILIMAAIALILTANWTKETWYSIEFDNGVGTAMVLSIKGDDYTLGEISSFDNTERVYKGTLDKNGNLVWNGSIGGSERVTVGDESLPLPVGESDVRKVPLFYRSDSSTGQAVKTKIEQLLSEVPDNQRKSDFPELK